MKLWSNSQSFGHRKILIGKFLYEKPLSTFKEFVRYCIHGLKTWILNPSFDAFLILLKLGTKTFFQSRLLV